MKNLPDLSSRSTQSQYLNSQKAKGLSPSSLARKQASLNAFSNFLSQRYQSTNQVSQNRSFKLIPPSLNLLPKHYALFAGLLLALSALTYGLYQQGIQNVIKNFAYPGNLTRPTRRLSFQGRLTDTTGTPITTSTEIGFRLFNNSIGGTQLYYTGTGGTVVPDLNGIFATTIGDQIGAEIPSDVFTENQNVYLEITMNPGGISETMTPRQLIATVGYALNAETLQGFPPRNPASPSSVLYLNSSGNLDISATSPTFTSLAGTFGIEGQGLLLKASDGSGGSITLNPDGNGVLSVLFEGTSPSFGDGFLNLSNANIGGADLISANILNDNRSYNFAEFKNFDVGTGTTDTRFSVSSYGDIYGDRNLQVGGSVTFSGIGSSDVGVGSSAMFVDPVSGQVFSQLLGSLAFSNTGVINWSLAGNIGATELVGLNDSVRIIGSNAIQTSSSTPDTITINLGGTLSQNTTIGTSSFSLSQLGLGNTLGLYLSSTGFVGIGTTAPNELFTVNGNANIGGSLFLTGLTSSVGSSALILDPSNGTVSNRYLAGLSFLAEGIQNGLSYLSGNIIGLGGTLTQNTIIGTSMFLGTNGQIGIGTTAPVGLITIGQIGNTSISQGLNLGGDVNLYRSSIYTLRTDSHIDINGNSYIDKDSGNFYTNGLIGNYSNPNNASISIGYSGLIITRDVTDDNPVTIIRNMSATSTGDILQLQGDASNTLSAFNRSGALAIGITTGAIGSNMLYVEGNSYLTGSLSVGSSLFLTGIGETYIGAGSTAVFIEAGTGRAYTQILGNLAFQNSGVINWNLFGDSGPAEFIGLGETASFLGRNGLKTWTSSPDSINISLGGTLEENVQIGTSSFALDFTSATGKLSLGSSLSSDLFSYIGNISLGATTVIRPLVNAVNSLSIGTSNGTRFVSFDTLNSRVGIGNTTPTNATVHISSLVGNAGLRVGAANSIYLISNSPNIGFNAYYNSSWKYSTANYGSAFGFNPVTGALLYSNSSASGAADASFTPVDRFTILANGNVGVSQATPGSSLSIGNNFSVGQAYANYAAPGNGAIFEGNVGVGNSSPATLLSVGQPGPGDVLGSRTPELSVYGSIQSATEDTVLRLARGTNSGSFSAAVADFSIGSYGAAGSPFTPRMYLNLALKSGNTNVETPTVNVLTLRDDLKVGIGNTAPTFTLTVAGDIGFSGQLSSNGSVGVSGQYLMSQGAALAPIWSGILLTANNATNGLSIYNGAALGLGGTLTQNTLIGTSSFSLSFQGIGNSQSLYIGSSGYVGIGTTAPTTKLDVNGPGNFNGTVGILDRINFSATYSDLRMVNNGYFNIYNAGTQSVLSVHADNGAIGIGGTAANTTPYLYVGATGKVGIGTTNLKYQFEVVGDALVSTRLGIGATNSNYGLNVSTNANIGTTLVAVDLNSTRLSTTSSATIGTTLTTVDLFATRVGTTTATVSGNLSVGGSVFFTGIGYSSVGSGSSAIFVEPVTGKLFTQLLGNLAFQDAGIINWSLVGDSGPGQYVGIGETASFLGRNGISTFTNYPDELYIGLGGTLAQNTFIGTSNFSLTFLGMGNSQALTIGPSGFVGIGTTNPRYKFEVTGDALISSRLGIGSTSSSFGLNVSTNANIGTTLVAVDLNGTRANIGTTLTAANIISSSLGANRVVIGGGASPLSTLSAGTSGQYLMSNGSGVDPTWSGISLNANNATNGLSVYLGYAVGLGGTLAQNTDINTSNFSLTFLGMGNSQALTIGPSGFVGIGTTNPTSKLEVNGNALISTLSVTSSATIGTTLTTVDLFATRVGTTTATVSGNLSVGGSVFFTGIGYSSVGSGSSAIFVEPVTGKLFTQLLGNLAFQDAGIINWSLVGDSGPGQYVGIGETASFLGRNGISTFTNYPDELYIGLGGTLAQNTFIGTSNFSLTFLGMGNSQALTIGPSGFVGIGTTNPRYKFEVTGDALISSRLGIGSTSSSFGLNVSTNANIGTTLVAVDLNGTRANIGTTLTAANIISSSLTANGIVIGGGASPLSTISLGTSGQFLQSNGVGVTPVWVNTIITGINGLSVTLGNNVGLGGTLTQNTRIGTSGYNLSFLNVNNNPSLTIGPSGYIGIGTANPNAYLHIQSPGGVNSGINLDLTSASSYGVIDFNTPGGLSGQFLATGSSYSNGIFTGDQIALASYLTNGRTTLVAGGSNGFINFATGGFAASNERMRLSATGNLGIGTTNPLNTLSVAGDALITTRLGIGGTNVNYGLFVSAAGIGVSGNSYFTGSLRIGATLLDSNGQPGTSGMLLQSTGVGVTWVPYAANNPSNGLSVISGISIGLGGTLIQNTSIGTSNFSLSFFGLGNSQALTIGPSGYIGIGTTNPTYKLQVVGNGLITAGLGVTGNSTFSDNLTVGDTAKLTDAWATGKVAIGTTNLSTAYGLFVNASGLGVTGNSTFSDNLTVGDTARLADLWASGKVAIGTTNLGTGYSLFVVGGIGVTGSSVFSGSLRLMSTLLDSNGSAGTAGMFLRTTATGVTWNYISSYATNGLQSVGTSSIGLGGTLIQNTSIGTSSFSLKFFDSSNNLSLSIGPSGYIGIGTSLANSKLFIAGTGFTGNFFTISDGTTQVNITSLQSTYNTPFNVTASGDVSIAYDINFNNPIASFIKSQAPLNLQSGEVFNSSDLNLRTFNYGNVVIDAGTSGALQPGYNLRTNLGSTTRRWNNAWIKTLNIGTSTWSLQSPDNSRLSFFNSDTGGTERVTFLSNGSVGIGTTSPRGLFQVGTDLGGTGPILVVKSAGSSAMVGIGTTSPLGMFQVGTNVGSTGPLFVVRSLGTTATVAIGVTNVPAGITLDVQGRVQVNLTGTQSTFAICHGTNGQSSDQELVDCSPSVGADYMEMYPVSIGAQVGDILATTSTPVATQDGHTIRQLAPATSTEKFIGILSDINNAGDFNSIGHNLDSDDNPLPVALVGRVPVRIDPNSQSISPGDPITISPSTPGAGQKATSAGFIVAKAIDSWNPGQGQATVMTFVNYSWYDPDLYLTEAGTLNQPAGLSDSQLSSLGLQTIQDFTQNNSYSISDAFGSTINRLGQYSYLITARLQAGLINTQSLISDLVITKRTISQDLRVDTISPLNSEVQFNGDVDIDGDLTVTKNLAVAGTIVADSLNVENSKIDNLVANTATISTLYADRVISREGDFGELLTSRVGALREELVNTIASISSTSGAGITSPPIAELSHSWIAEISTNSAQFNGNLKLTDNMVIAGKLAVQGDTELANALISQRLTVDHIQIGQNYIKSLNSSLAIQPDRSGTVTINGDVLAIAEDGSVTINGSLNVTGTIASSGVLTTFLQAEDASLSGKLNIATDSATLIIAEAATASASSTSAQIASNASAGTATLPAGKTELVINSDKLSANSLVYITPQSSTQNQVLYVKSKLVPIMDEATPSATPTPSFTVALDTPLPQDVLFNWWLIN